MLILALLSMGPLMVVLDFSIVNVALPTEQRQFHLSAADLQWVVSAYALTFGGFLLLGGRLCDFVNRKAVFMAGLAPFRAGLAGWRSGASAAAHPRCARRAGGLGAALLAPAALALATTTFAEGPERNRALGIIGAVTGIGFAAGALLGGLRVWPSLTARSHPQGVACGTGCDECPWPSLSPSRSRGYPRHSRKRGCLVTRQGVTDDFLSHIFGQFCIGK